MRQRSLQLPWTGGADEDQQQLPEHLQPQQEETSNKDTPGIISDADIHRFER